jgi:hypothetical protein
MRREVGRTSRKKIEDHFSLETEVKKLADVGTE